MYDSLTYSREGAYFEREILLLVVYIVRHRGGGR